MIDKESTAIWRNEKRVESGCKIGRGGEESEGWKIKVRDGETVV